MKDFRIYIIVASLLLVIYLLAEYNQPKPVVWTPTYLKEDKIPYGTYVLFNSIGDIFPGAKVESYREPVYNVVNDHHINNATYIIICEHINLTEFDIKKLLEFIKKGNDVLISAQSFGDLLTKKLKVETDMNYDPKNPIDKIHFVNKHLGQNKKYALSKEQYDTYFSELDTLHATSLAQNDFKQSTFVKYGFGKGTLYLNANPEFFTNYSLLNPNGAEYAAKVLSYLKNNKLIIWDEYYTKGREGDQSIMRVFFRNASLKWAYYIALISMVFFVFYEMKRRQRIIPVIEPLKNSTVDFVNVVGQVYYEQRNNLNIAQKKILYFLEHLRTKYYLKTNALETDFIEHLSQKTGIEHSFANNIVSHINYINVQNQVTDRDLIYLNQLIEQFYTQSR
ncbi:MAG TPA: DUF4350 domain-containing protein [Mucilaginibacter sp.]|nr:DUF4350 domain-containing protein [Mucilaginibacter sp.]